MVHEYTLITRYVVLLYVHMYEHTPNTFSREASTFFRLDRKEQSTLQDYHRGFQKEHVWMFALFVTFSTSLDHLEKDLHMQFCARKNA